MPRYRIAVLPNNPYAKAAGLVETEDGVKHVIADAGIPIPVSSLDAVDDAFVKRHFHDSDAYVTVIGQLPENWITADVFDLVLAAWPKAA